MLCILYQCNSQMSKLMNERVICPSPENKFSVTILLKVKAKTSDNLGHDLEDYRLRVHGMFLFTQ